MNDAAAVLNHVQRRALLAAAAGVLLCVVSLVQGLDPLLHSYLFAFSNCLGIALGCLGLLMMHHVASGRWSFLMQRVFEAGALTIPFLLLLFIPIALSLSHLYPWTQPAASPARAVYLNTGFFIARALLYFALWTGLALLLRRSSIEDKRHRLEILSGPGLVVYVLTASFAAIDWTMSLEPEWTSTIYGLSVIVGQGLSALALSVLIVSKLAEIAPLNTQVQPNDFNDFGNMLLVFVLLSAYVNFSQFLIIWSGNLPDEAVWYLRRSHGGWQYVAVLLAIGQFLIPFLMLLSRRIKGRAGTLAPVAILILLAHTLEWYWLVIPAFEMSALPRLSDVAAPLALGGLCLAAMIQPLKHAPLIPHDEIDLRLKQNSREETA